MVETFVLYQLCYTRGKDSVRSDTAGNREDLGKTVGIHLRALAPNDPESARQKGKELSDEAYREAGLPAIVVLRDPVSQQAAVCAVSVDADRSLTGKLVATDSSAGRASMSGAAVAGETCADLLGPQRGRHQTAMGGMAIPLRDGASNIGALVVFGSIRPTEHKVTRLTKMADLAGSGIARALESQTIDCQATVDPLTGLPNRGGFCDEVAEVVTDGVLLQFDLQSLPNAVQVLGNPATTFGERQLGRDLQEIVRASDVLARVTPGTFAAWMRNLGASDLDAVRQRLADVATKPRSIGHDTWWTPDWAVTVAGLGRGREVAAQWTGDRSSGRP